MAGEASGHILQTTALVHEVYLRLVDFREISWQNRAYFFGVCARLMRQILVDFARSRRRLKRGGEAPQVSLDEALVVSREAPTNLLALDEALNRLSQVNERAGQVVKLCFFVGLTQEQAAQELGLSVATVERDWAFARAWLFREMRKDADGA